MLNFTVGPVQSNDEVRQIGAENVPYFRTPEFSKKMIENEELILEFARAKKGSKVVFMTCSGTGSMEASIINTLTKEDKAIVVNGGSFGSRFVELLKIHNIYFSEIKLKYGETLKEEHLKKFESGGFTAFLINMHETSTGVLYDMNLVSNFCTRNNLFLIVDAISSFLADHINMDSFNADVLISGSQKALACPPGISFLVLSPRAISRIEENEPHCMYLNLKLALENQLRGQTPFTPAVSTLLQINSRLKEIKKNGGADSEVKRTHELASYFRERIKGLPLAIVSESLSNAVTPLHPINFSAYSIFTILKDEYGIWVCPNSGDMKETIFRVGHIGCLKKADYDTLLDALIDIQKRGLL